MTPYVWFHGAPPVWFHGAPPTRAAAAGFPPSLIIAVVLALALAATVSLLLRRRAVPA
jgi:hypothetical protein